MVSLAPLVKELDPVRFAHRLTRSETAVRLGLVLEPHGQPWPYASCLEYTCRLGSWRREEEEE